MPGSHGEHHAPQTEEYAREILSHGIVPAKRGVEDAVARRLERQRRITGPGGPNLSMVLSEGALRRQVGGSEVRRGQLRFLRQIATLPNVSLRVLPFDGGTHTALGFSFSLLRVGNPAATFAYTESFADSHWHSGAPQTETYVIGFDRVYRSALPEQETREFIDQIAEHTGDEQ